MDYEKAYKEAMEKVRSLHDNADEVSKLIDLKEELENIFPELKESEDEKIMKALINGFNKLDKSGVWYNGITNGQILAWLEKQGEQKIADKCEGCNNVKGCITCANGDQWAHIGEQKPAWNEEDEQVFNTITNSLDRRRVERVWHTTIEEVVNWFESLKDRVQLKSLRPQNRWKPSDEQMEALLKLEEMHVIEHENNQENAHLYMVVKSIREQLLKLREE